MEGTTKKLTRSKKNRVLLGVLGGIAEYFEVDPTLVRLIFIVLLVFQPVAMTLIYFLAAIVIPEEGGEEKPIDQRVGDVARDFEKVISGNDGSKTNKIIALVLILLGIFVFVLYSLPLLIAGIYFKIPGGYLSLLPVVLILVGVVLLLKS